MDLDKSIKFYVDALMENQRFGIHKERIRIQIFPNVNNQFELSVPYAEHIFRSHVLFDLDFLELGPDFVFENNNFLFDPTANEIANHIPSLANWNWKNPKALFNVIRELISYYKEFQKKLSAEYTDNIKTQLDLFGSKINDNCEIICLPNIQEVQVFMKLDLDFSELPYRDLKPIDDSVIVCVSYQYQSRIKVTCKLMITEDLKEILAKDFQTLNFTDQILLFEYIPQLTEQFQEKINSVINSYQKKRDFIGCLLVYQRKSILEYNSIDYSYVSLMVEIEGTPYIINIKFPETFPDKKPHVTCREVHTESSVRPAQVTQFQYNMDMSPKEMISSIFDWIYKHELEKLQQKMEHKKRQQS